MNNNNANKTQIIIKKILYQIKNRGFKEIEIILNRFFQQKGKNLSIEEYNDLLILLNEEDHNIYNYIIKIQKIPSHLNKNLINKIHDSMLKNL